MNNIFKFEKTNRRDKYTIGILLLILILGAGFYLFKNRDRTQDYIAFQDSLFTAFCPMVNIVGCRDYSSEAAVKRVVDEINKSDFLGINCDNLLGTYRQICRTQQDTIKKFFLFTDNGKNYGSSDFQYLSDIYQTVSKN